MIFRGLNDLSVQTESNDTHYDHDLKIFGSRLGHCFIYITSVKKLENPELSAKPSKRKLTMLFFCMIS